MAKAVKETKVDIDSFLKVKNSETRKSKKSEIPIISTQRELADDTNELLAEYEALEAQVKTVKAKIHEVMFPEYAARAKADDFTKSINIEGKNTGGVQVTYTDRFSDIAIDHEADITKACDFDKYFERKVGLKLKEQTIDSVKALVAILGKDKFSELFETQYVISCKEDMDRKQFTMPEKVRELLKQAAPSIKRIKQ